ncbi:MAG: PilZ domain-containing protein [Deltaproteobacteria bacterium]|nr:PilZ domain-containing protein [Deltaproteobacteria bacterium]MBW2625352.1 PilZ domain-containing protein [Deltaproteobacteria bacterium]
MDKPTGRERRQHPRAVVSWPVIIKSSRGLMAGETKDISFTGAFISCREPLKPSEVLEVSISVSLLSPRVQAIAEVVWSNPSRSDEEFKPRGMGVRFTKIDTTDHEMISALVADHLDMTDQDRPGEDLTA